MNWLNDKEIVDELERLWFIGCDFANEHTNVLYVGWQDMKSGADYFVYDCLGGYNTSVTYYEGEYLV